MIKRCNQDGDLTDAVAEIRCNGVVIIERLFSVALMDVLLADVEGELDAQALGGGQFFGGRKRSVNGLFARGRASCAGC